jgi:hypothetical protein
MAGKINREQAEKEVNAWLDHKHFSEKRRELKKDAIENLISAIEDGSLTMDPESFKITQQLLFPLKNEKPVEQLVFLPRITVDAVQKSMGGTKADDLHGMVKAYVCALTTQPKGVIAALDTEDYDIAQKIAIFFM